MAEVAIIMGSDSDVPVMAKAASMLEDLKISYEMRIISAHREPEELFEYMHSLEEKDTKVVIAGAGKAAALPGMCAALFPYPVIGVPMKTSDLGGVDSLYSIVQMPTGVPVATVAINGAGNAALLAAQILSTGDETIKKALADYRQDQKASVIQKDETMQKDGYKAFL